MSTQANAGQLLLHTFTAHIHDPGLEAVTPGIAYQTNGYRFGILRNSYRFTSVYMSRIYPITNSLRTGVGIVSGYGVKGGCVVGRRNGLIPFIAVEKDLTDNVSLVWFATAINLEVRW